MCGEERQSWASLGRIACSSLVHYELGLPSVGYKFHGPTARGERRKMRRRLEQALLREKTRLLDGLFHRSAEQRKERSMRRAGSPCASES